LTATKDFLVANDTLMMAIERSDGLKKMCHREGRILSIIRVFETEATKKFGYVR
jgi:hypothetical protein